MDFPSALSTLSMIQTEMSADLFLVRFKRKCFVTSFPENTQRRLKEP